MRLLLASQSAARRRMLEAAGVAFETVAADARRGGGQGRAGRRRLRAARPGRDAGRDEGDERRRRRRRAGARRRPGARARRRHDAEQARLARRGARAAARAERPHPLSALAPRWSSSAASASGARPRRVGAATCAPLGDAFLEAYLDAEYEAVRWNVGGYRIEGLGAQLFEEIEGSHFTVLGMPLLPLLGSLRERGLLRELMGVPYAEVIGDPIAQSKSPLIHKFWLEKLGIEGDYAPSRVAPRSLPDYLAARRADPDWRGCNVTMPHKQAVMPHARRLDPRSPADRRGQHASSRDGRHADGHNTDVAGVRRAAAAIGIEPARAAWRRVIGTGGAARAVVCGARRPSASRMIVLDRPRSRPRPRRCSTISISAASTRGSAARRSDDAGRVGRCDLSSTPARSAWTGQPPLPIDLAPLLAAMRSSSTWSTRRSKRRCCKRRARAGLRTIDGLTMLIGQAAVAFELFFGAPPPREHDAELRALLTS